MTAEALVSRYRLYARLRWVGVGLFCCALPIPLLVVAAATMFDGRWGWLFPAMGTLGLSLGAFGTANDTALWSLRQAARLGALPTDAASELRHELSARPERLEALHDSPKASWLIPIFAASLIGWMGMRVWGAWAA
ncbi:hypothetical protein LBMAG42_19100 [Deltaproteobacteria bacterium]|nr:hypothetical protein LBMAG42_19100 [Deltaproteobacteria bacterium]